MSVRRLFAGVVTTSVVAASWAVVAPASADPSFTPTAADVIGVGSDTSQDALTYLADGRDGVAGYNAGRSTGRLASYNATGGGNITLPSGSIARPNGSGAGKKLLYGSGNNTDVDFARSSSAIDATEKSAGLFAFPFAKDTLALATAKTTNAPASISAADMVKIYNGTVTDWSQLGGAAGAIVPMIPQTGSGTRSFFTDQLKAANGGNPVVLTGSVREVQEHDATPIQGNANAVAPFSTGRNTVAGSPLRIEGGFVASRALYNVVRQADVAKPEITSIFGESGFVCSAAAKPLITKAGFEQLLPRGQGGVCGVPTQDPTTNLATQQVATTTTVTGASTTPGALALTATVGGASAPDGIVSFFLDGAAAPAASAPLTGGKATRTLSGVAAGSHTVVARYTPSANSLFLPSASAATPVTVTATAPPAPPAPPAVVKATSKIAETFASKVKRGKKAAGVVSVTTSVAGRTATGQVLVKLGKKVVGKATLRNGKAALKLKGLRKGKNKLTITYVSATAATVAGSTTTFTIKQL